MRTAHLTHQSKPHANLFACCSFRHGLRRATFLREEGFGFPRSPSLSLPLGEMSRSDREGGLPLRGSWICRRQRLREFYKSDKIRMRSALIRTCLRAAPSVTACAAPPSSGRKALVLRTIQTCLSLWERCRAATERAGFYFQFYPSTAVWHKLRVLPLHRWRGPPPLSGAAKFGSPERGAVTE